MMTSTTAAISAKSWISTLIIVGSSTSATKIIPAASSIIPWRSRASWICIDFAITPHKASTSSESLFPNFGLRFSLCFLLCRPSDLVKLSFDAFPFFTKTSHTHLYEITRVAMVLLGRHVRKFDRTYRRARHICTRAKLLGAKNNWFFKLLLDLMLSVLLSSTVSITTRWVASARGSRSRSWSAAWAAITIPLVLELSQLFPDL